MTDRIETHGLRPDRHTLTRRWALAGALLCAGPPCAAFGGVGFLAECSSFTSCDAALASGASWNVRYAVTDATASFVPLIEAPNGLGVYQGHAEVQTSAPVLAVRGQFTASNSLGFFGARAQAQSDFGLNRAAESADRGVGGTVLQNSLALDSAHVVVQTFAEASSAWRDVWSFSGNGHLSALIAVDGTSGLFDPTYLPPTSLLTPRGDSGDWFYDLRIWDVTNQTVSDDFELGGPTLVARASARGDDERRASFADSLALEFDFMAGTSYVVTGDLRVTGFDGRNIDLFHTARLHDIKLTGGVNLVALSGHDWLGAAVSPVPEPSGWALMIAGLLAVGRIARRRRD